MKLQCDLCKEIVAADFAVVGGGIEVTCPACAGKFTAAPTRKDAPIVELARARAARRAPAPGEPSIVCPKCGDEQPPAAACRGCGLLADRMAEFVRDRDAKVPPEVSAAWDEVGAGWADGEAHDRFVRAVAAAMFYPWAAQRYRDALRLRPDDAVASAQLARLARMAEVTLLATASKKPAPSERPYRHAVTLLVGLVVVAVIGIGYALIVSRQNERARETGPASRPLPGEHPGGKVQPTTPRTGSARP